MSDYEGNVHQMGYAEDYEGPDDDPLGIGAPYIINPCNYCGHSKEDHEDTCNLCECIQFEDSAEPEEVEER